MDKKSDPQSGRVAFDERGKSMWEWRVGTGEFKQDIDTRQLKQIQEKVTVTLADAPQPPVTVGGDPYSTTAPATTQKAPRRTLDDMRKLSEEIKRNRQQK